MRPREELEIMKDWDPKYREVMVSVRCIAYNQAHYIEQALDSFLMQETNFPFEIVVHDDASTDGTAEIIARYQKKYPQIVKALFEVENQYSKGDGSLGRIMNEHTNGKYVAVCEGDDYWIDKKKLQCQFDVMENHPEVDICAHSVQMVNAKSGKTVGYICPEDKDTVISADRVILGDGGFVGTNSLFYRRSLIENIPSFRRKLNIDYTLQVHGSLRGGMLYLSKCMSAYRVMADGSWSLKFANEGFANKIELQWEEMEKQLDVDTNGKYHEIIELYVITRKINSLVRFKHYSELKKYKNFWKKLEGNKRKKFFLKINFPRMWNASKHIRDMAKK